MLKELVQQFENCLELPIEVEDIAAAIIRLGVADEIHFVPVAADPATIHGAFVRFRYHPVPYGDPVWVTHIPYNSADPLDLQRVVCCKEMMHIFDSDLERTDTRTEVPEFMDKLLGPLTTEDFGLADYMASKDKLAVYMCLPLLFPKAALQVAREAVKDRSRTPEEIAEWAKLPLRLVNLMIQEDWDTINGLLHK
ncbi:MAG: hypothetical protein R3D60_10075 [Paracoccaceae bacterium]